MSSISRRIAVITCRRPTGTAGVPGSVTSTASVASRASSSDALERLAARVERGLDRLARLVGGAADGAALLRRQLRHAAQQVGQLRLAAEEGDPRLLELGGARRGRDGSGPLGLELVDLVLHARATLVDFVERDRGRHRRVQRLGPDRDVHGLVAGWPARPPTAPRARRRSPASPPASLARHRLRLGPPVPKAPGRCARRAPPCAPAARRCWRRAPPARRRSRPSRRAPPCARTGRRCRARAPRWRRRTPPPSAARCRRCRGR